MSDHLHHDFAGAVLMAPDDPAHIEDAICALLPEHPLPFKVTLHSHDVDVPIPLIFEFDTATILQLPNGEIFANLRGEAYDRTFNLRVEVRKNKTEAGVLGESKGSLERVPVVEWPQFDGEEGRARWNVGWQAAKDAGLELPDISFRGKLISALFDPVFAEDLEKIVALAAGI